MKKLLIHCMTVGLVLMSVSAMANNIASSTMYYHGQLTDNGDGTYSGVLAMIDEGGGDSGYDIYGEEGANAWFGNDPGSGPVWTSQAIGADHDAWPAWTPDTPDWYQYSLNLYVDGGQQRWAVQNHPGATAANPWDDTVFWGESGKPPAGVPMSGSMLWYSDGTGGYAEETDTGAYLPATGVAEIPGGAAANGGGAHAWDMDWSWGSEVVPLEYPGFEVTVVDLGGGAYDVIMTPAVHQNTIPSSTMYFEGALTDAGGGIYTGTINMTNGGLYAEGGFDVYAEAGSTAYVTGDTWPIDSSHDAYSAAGPWGSWWDPDVPDWNQYSLELTADHWYLRYTSTGESPMSGAMDWSIMYATETDLGTQDGAHGGSAAQGGGAGAWDWDCGWGVEVIPLELPGFQVGITDLGGGQYEVRLIPANLNLSFTVTPNDLADGPTFLNGQGGVPFGYDPDSVKPEGVFLAGPAGFGDSCFWADVQGSAAGGGVDYTAIRLSPKDIFGVSDVTISDLLEISYYTKWVSDLDWQLKIYTEDDTEAKWYGYRFNFTRPTFGDNNWNQSSTDTNLTVADIFDKVANGYVAVPGDNSLSGLNPLYGSQKILFIDIISSYMTESPPGDSYLDGIQIELTNGDGATLDLAASPTTAWVDDDYCDGCANDGHTWGYDAFDNIQDGIDAIKGSTVNVAAGTYPEQVIINKSLTLTGSGNPTILAPGSVNPFKFPENSKWWEPVVFAFGGTDDGAGNISGTDTIEVTINGFEINGDDRVPTSGRRAAGILLRNVAGSIEDNTVGNMHIDGFETFGISAYGDSNLTILSNVVSGYSRGGIGVSGDLGPLPDPYADIEGNTVSGPGLGVSVTWAPNGIQIGGGGGTTGTIVENEVSGNGWPGTEWSGSGIILFACANVLVQGNNVHSNETGIATIGDIFYGTGDDVSGTTIKSNTVQNNTYGISLQDKTVNTTIQFNTVSNSTYDGIGVINFYADNQPTGTIINYNYIFDNNTAGDPSSGGLWVGALAGNAQMVDAEFNWWGNASGPQDSEGSTEVLPCTNDPITEKNDDGTGNAVIGNADYCPWQLYQNPDVDNDGICNPYTVDPSCEGSDNCPLTPNSGQEDNYPPSGNDIGDACECEADFDHNGAVDADDVERFLWDFGRSEHWDPCTNKRWCYGDFQCDGAVDAEDVEKFLEDFGRSLYYNPCPKWYSNGAWCSY